MSIISVPSSVKIMAVTKTVPIDRILPVLMANTITLIGESRWQEAKIKLPYLPEHIKKHFIGHLQTNKTKEVIAAFDVIQSIDSIKIMRAIALEAAKLNKVMPIFLQVNISRDTAKHGFLVEELDTAITEAQQLPALIVSGLMTITAREAPDQIRADYKHMKQLQQHFQLSELSMGMSHDWPIAVEEGATIIRLGTALFGERPQP